MLFERYGNGKHEWNELDENKKVRIADHEGNVDVYECETDDEAEKIANWYISAGYETYPYEVELNKKGERYFTVEVID